MKDKIYNWGAMVQRNWRHIATLFFFAGFIVDSIFLPDYLNPLSRYLGAIYIIVATILILIKNNGQLFRPSKNKMLCMAYDKVCVHKEKLSHGLNFALAFTIGSALSFVFIYYYRSVQIIVMWPLLVLIFALMCMNEFIRSESRRNLIEIGMLMFTMYLYTLYVFPTLFYNLTNYTLILAIVFALMYNMALTRAIVWEKEGSDEEVNRFGYKLLMTNIAVPIIIALLYITHNLPAVPVTLKDVHVYNAVRRDVVKNNSVYTSLTYIKDKDSNSCRPQVEDVSDTNNYWEMFKGIFISKSITIGCVEDYSSKLVAPAGSSSSTASQIATNTNNRVTVYTAIYMPGYFYKTNNIINDWQYYDDNANEWVTKKKVVYPIQSGRDGGYRGYTSIDNPSEGNWKLRVLNSDGRMIGEYKFKVNKI